MTTTALYETLVGLPDDEWELLRVRLREFTVHIPGPREARSLQVAELVGAAERQRRVSVVREELGAVQAVFRRTRNDTVGWLRTLRQRHGQLRVLGLYAGDADQWLDLDQVYVEVELRRQASAFDGLVPDRLPHRKGRALLAPRESALDAARTVGDALSAVRRTGRGSGLRGVVVVGLPGTGKTTALQRLWCQAHDQWTQHPDTAPLPLLLRCATLQHIGVYDLGPGDLVRLAELEARNDRFPGAGERLLTGREGPLLVLLDGLDELRDPADRAAVGAWLVEETERWPGSDWVVTTRRATWNDAEQRIFGQRLAPFDLLALTPAAITDYIRKWFRLAAQRECAGRADEAVEDAISSAGRDAAVLIEQLGWDRSEAEYWRIRGLTGNPLTLSTVCLVYRRFHLLPQGRGLLYAQCFEVLLRGRHRPGRPPELDRQEGVRLLAPLAWQMQEGTDDVAEASPKEVPQRVILDALMQSREAVERLAAEDPEVLLRRLVHECGVLYTADQVNYQFVHLTFQEWLAAEYARARNLGGQLAALAGDARWAEPILLAMAEDGLKLAFWQAILAGPVARHEALLRRCLREADPDPEPFVVFLGRAAAGEVAVADVGVVLGLFGAKAPAPVRTAARALVEHPDETVRGLARELCGVEAPRTPGQRSVGSRLRCEPLEMELVWVPADSFLMGATNKAGQPGHDEEAYNDEAPVHRVRLTRGFWLGRHPVTIAQYRRYVTATGAEEPACFRSPGRDDPAMPVTDVSWLDVRGYLRWASAAAGMPVTLPTEAEWEYAARGTDGRTYPWIGGAPTLERAWYGAAGWDGKAKEWKWELGEHRDTVKGVARVGGRPGGAGPFGAEDQAGNVLEWCADRYDVYPPGEQVDPHLDDALRHPDDKEWPKDDKTLRVLRGGSWVLGAWGLRAAYRSWYSPRDRYWNIGFRVVFRPPELA